MNGYIRLFRKFVNWEWYKNTNTKILFLHCLLKANWEDGKFEGLEVKRGSFVTSIESLAIETGLTIQEVRTALKHLISTNEVTNKSTNKYRIITIVNYELYQQVDKQINNQSTDNQQSSNNQLTTNEKEKEEKKEKEYIYNNTIYELIESNFGRTLNSIEYELIQNWKDDELTRYAIKQAVLNNKFSIKYIDSILYAYERENIKTVQQAQERENQFKNKNQKNNQKVPEWFDKKIQNEKMTKEDEEELDRLLQDL